MMLLYKGIFWYSHPRWLLFPAILVGSIKSLLFLDRSAARIIRRIAAFPEKMWLFAVYPLKTWIMVAAMMAFGLFLKYSPTPTIVTSFIYCSVGWGLLFSGRSLWRAFFTDES